MARLWDHGEPLDELILRYTAGEDHVLDDRLVEYDLRASSAHAQMLQIAGYLHAEDEALLQKALKELARSYKQQEWKITLQDEDCHTAIENRLVAMVGEPGRAIHLGRSRNDQVLAAMRLYLMDALEELAKCAEAVAGSLDELAEHEGAFPMPGYTHLQRAMPTTLKDWAKAYASEFFDDAQGLRSAKRRANKNPLGSAAGYGVPLLKIDRGLTAQLLGFSQVHEPVTAVQLSRGKAEAGALLEAALFSQDLGRLAADLCLYATAEFAFVRLPNEFTTGSSIMPQKRNPDVFELARGRSGEALAGLNEVMAITSKMPSGYHRDLQLIKKPLFRGLDSVRDTAAVLNHSISRLSFDKERMLAAIDPSMMATERAYRMVQEDGIAFREAYRRVKESIK
jgi:argininosuccinate lyase